MSDIVEKVRELSQIKADIARLTYRKKQLEAYFLERGGDDVLDTKFKSTVYADPDSQAAVTYTEAQALTIVYPNYLNITGTTTITVNLSNIKYGDGNTKQCQFWVYRNDYSTGDNRTEMELSKGLSGATKENYGSATATVSKAGNYIIEAILFSVTGSQSGVSFYNGSCDYTITFS